MHLSPLTTVNPHVAHTPLTSTEQCPNYYSEAAICQRLHKVKGFTTRFEPYGFQSKVYPLEHYINAQNETLLEA